MAFKRSGVRLPLAPPVNLLILSYFFDQTIKISGRYRTGEARGKHAGLPAFKPRGASAESRRVSKGSGARHNGGTLRQRWSRFAQASPSFGPQMHFGLSRSPPHCSLKAQSGARFARARMWCELTVKFGVT